MRLLLLFGLIGLSAAVEDASTACSTTVVVTQTAVATPSSDSASILTVATDDSGDFTEIGDAISQAQSKNIPTITVLAGTYPAVTVSATPTATIIGESDSKNDFSKNKVIISSDGTVLTIAEDVAGLAFKNINFINTASSGEAVTIWGTKNGFYSSQFISAGSVAITAKLGLAVIANSYIEASGKMISGAANLYIFNTLIVPTSDSAAIIYNQGTTSDDTLYNSTIVLDQSTVSPKAGVDIAKVSLAAASGPGSVVVYRGSSLGSLIVATGVRVDDKTQDKLNFYGEYDNTGPGAFAENADIRLPYVMLLSASGLAPFTLDAVLAEGYPDFATSDTSWIDPAVLAAIESADVLSPSTTGSSGDGTGSGSGDGDNGSGTGDGGSGSGSGDDSNSGSGDNANDSGSGSSGSGDGDNSSTSGDGDNNGDVYVVSKNPSKEEYSSVTSAISALPDDGKPYIISVKAGNYKDQITISRKGKVTIRGQTSFANDFTENSVTIKAPDNSDDTVSITIRTDDGTLTALYNIDFKNKNVGTSTSAALVADFHGKVAVYGSSFIGYKNTLLANKGTQVFSNSYIEGSTDFIWGFSTTFFHQSYIAVNTAGGFIAAQSRSSAKAKGGFVIDSSVVTYTSSYGDDFEKTYLGRPYSEYSLVVYMNSYLGKLINPAGWAPWSKDSPRTGHVEFYEYDNTGPGRWSDSRAPFAKELSKTEAEDYTLSNWIGDTSWLDMKAYNLAPSYDLTDPTFPAPTSGSGTTSTATSSASATWAHPSSGTTPPAGAVIVSQSNGDGNGVGSYSNLTDALASLPSDDSTQVIFVYTGSYNEQVPAIDRDGPVMIIGYTEKDPGRGYTDNEVTITFSRGLPLPAQGDHTDAETATVSTASKKIAFYNVNMVNTANLDGSESSYVTLAASVFGTHIAFYGCSFVGWQETLLTGSEDGYLYYESSYIEGEIDIITGPATAYFKGCTIGAKKRDSAFTAQSRPSSKTGGYVFDQCSFGPAFLAPTDLTETVYLGRPRSEYALVVVKNSYLGNVINPSGWEAWSSEDPRTDHVLFGEYKNTGPGNWENNSDVREALGFGTLLGSDKYSLKDMMDSTDWIDLTYYDSITVPRDVPGSGSGESDGSSPNSTSTAASNGTTPPSGAYIVSKTSIANTKTYDSIQDALDALPSSDKTSTIFIYPGTYEEQLIVDIAGTVILIGSSKSIDDFSANRVTIKHDAGAEIESSKSLSDGATVYAKGSGQLQAVNINFANNNSKEKEAAVAFAVGPSTYASLYGCQVTGGQDALFVEGYIFTSNTYIEGSSDIILASGAGYFLNSTLSPTEDAISLTADKRAKNASAGLVFDQSSIAPAAGAGSLSNVSLGRPWNSFARVAYIKSDLGSLIKAAGWDQWSPSSPRTGDVLFGEYGNSGPGSDTSDRAPFASQLDDDSVAQFEIGTFFERTSWIDFARVAATPFKAEDGNPSTPNATSTATSSDAPTASDSPTTSSDAPTTSSDSPTASSDAPTASSDALTPSSGGDQTTTEADITSPTTAGLPTTTVTTTSIETVAADGAVKVIDSTTTVVVTSTAAPKTTTSKSTLTTTSTKTADIETSKVTSTVTVFTGPEGTTTTQVQPTTVFSTKTDTESVTTTLTCIPTRIASSDQPHSRDATPTVAHSPMMTAAATPSPTTVTVQATETSTTTLYGPILTTSYKTLTQTAKFIPPDVTVLSTETKTVKAVLALPVVTSTKLKTTTYTRTPSVPVTVKSTSTKTQKVTSTTTKTVTTTAKGATPCAT